ncbi:hypothetical protein Tco_0041615, partial [Tanacetum coccineum]
MGEGTGDGDTKVNDGGDTGVSSDFVIIPVSPRVVLSLMRIWEQLELIDNMMVCIVPLLMLVFFMRSLVKK